MYVRLLIYALSLSSARGYKQPREAVGFCFGGRLGVSPLALLLQVYIHHNNSLLALKTPRFLSSGSVAIPHSKQ